MRRALEMVIDPFHLYSPIPVKLYKKLQPSDSFGRFSFLYLRERSLHLQEFFSVLVYYYRICIAIFCFMIAD